MLKKKKRAIWEIQNGRQDERRDGLITNNWPYIPKYHTYIVDFGVKVYVFVGKEAICDIKKKYFAFLYTHIKYRQYDAYQDGSLDEQNYREIQYFQRFTR